jgi:hypothetical protein
LSEVSVTTVPDGEVIVTSRSPLFACCRKVVTFTSRRYGFKPDTTIDDVVTPLSVSAVAVLFVNVCGVPVQATGTVVDVVLDVDVLLVEDDVELDVDELVLVDDDVEEDVLEDEDVDDEVVDEVDVLEVVDEDVLVVVDLVVDVEVDVDVLVVVDFVVDVEVDVEDDVVELDVLVDDDVVVVVLVAKSHPMSVKASRVRSVTWSALVYDGSIIWFGVRTVSQCDTDEPDSTGLGAYIRTWPPDMPALKYPVAAARTLLPVQWRLPLLMADALRSASVMAVHIFPVEWSSRNFMKTSSRLAVR